MNSVKKFISLFFVLCCITGFASASGAQEQSENGVVELTFRQNDPVGEVGGLLEAIDSFNEMHPEIHVTYEQVPWDDALNQFIREGHAGGGADVIQTAFVWTKDLADAGLVMNLDNFISANPPGIGIEDFIGTDLGIIKESVYGIPWSVDTYSMAYNPELFQQAGIQEFPATWEEMYEVARDISEKTGSFGLAFPGDTWFAFNYYLWSNGSTLLQQDSSGNWSVSVSESELSEAIDYFAEFFAENINPKTLIGATTWGDIEILDGLSKGEIAMAFLPPAPFRVAQDKSEFILQTAMIPSGSVRRVSHLGGRAIVMNKNTDHPDEAWELIKFLVSEKVFNDFKYPQFPAQVSMLDKLEYNTGEDGYAKQLPFAITLKQYIESPAPVSGMEHAVNSALTSVYSGEKDSSEAASNMVRSLEELLEN